MSPDCYPALRFGGNWIILRFLMEAVKWVYDPGLNKVHIVLSIGSAANGATIGCGSRPHGRHWRFVFIIPCYLFLLLLYLVDTGRRELLYMDG